MRPIFKTRKNFQPYESTALDMAEELHHVTNRAYKTLDLKKTDFDQYVSLAGAYMLGVMDYSRARVRDVVSCVSDYLIECAEHPDTTPDRIAFLISPSFGSAAAQELEHLYEGKLPIKYSNLEKTILENNGTQSDASFTLEPMQQLRLGLLKGEIYPESKIFTQFLALDAAYRVGCEQEVDASNKMQNNFRVRSNLKKSASLEELRQNYEQYRQQLMR